ncbi:hypothetical protein [Alterileibacterium massiliense]|uniref:hypothetical protein n=1 Tax=Alterileibacterium massiliense TaxID=1870997 RepID=UPI0008DA3A89|nr:hypothetical protein [Alterileibacterium massiliense]
MIDIHELKPSENNSFLMLWSKTFGDSKEEILEFMTAFSDDIKCFTLTDSDNKSDNKNDVLSALTLFKMGNLHIPCKKKSPEVFVSYAICTDEKCRGKGYGASITNFASDYVTNYNNKINKNSSDSSDDCDAISILSPASKSLVNFYKPLGYEPFFFSKYHSLGEISDKSMDLRLSEISHSEYDKKREHYLEPFVHVSLSAKSLIYLSGYSKFLYFEIVEKSIKGIAVYSESSIEDEILISELLAVRISSSSAREIDENSGFLENFHLISEKEIADVANAITKTLGFKRCEYRTPAYCGNNFSDEIVQGMIFGDFDFIPNDGDEAENNLSYLPYLGFPFD